MLDGTIGKKFHHDSRGYEAADGEAVRAGRAKMDQLIAEGRAGAMRLAEEVHTRKIADALPTGADLAWEYDERKRLALRVKGDAVHAAGLTVHRHALGQLAAKAGIPGSYLASLVGSENPTLREQGAALLGAHYHTTDLADESHLVRVVDGEARAVLSAKYKRLDSRPLLEAFAEVCKTYGAIPVSGTLSDVRMQLKAYLPTVFEPIPGEVMLVGLAWSNSDFGAGAHGMALTILRVWCTNKATTDTILRQVHTGKRLEAEGIAFSRETVQLETQYHASMLRDMARSALGPDRVNGLMRQIRDAGERGMTWEGLRKAIATATSKSEQEAIKIAFEGADTHNMPAGKTAWRASNAVSWIAGQVEDADRKLDLERLAGSLMLGKKATEVQAAA